MKKHWVCTACGYIYEGDDPPDTCPGCGAPKQAFYPRMEMPQTPSEVPPPGEKRKEVGSPQGGMKHWVCTACGYIHEGAEPPDYCPTCKAPQKAFYPRMLR
jgi:rubrerythrin